MTGKLPRATSWSLVVGVAAASVLAAAWTAGVAAQPGPPRGAAYAWAPVGAQTMSHSDPRVSSPAFQAQIRTAIETALNAKGYHKAADISQAQVLVAYHVGVKTKTDTKPSKLMVAQPACASPGCSDAWGVYGPPRTQVREVKYHEGALVLDLTDAKSGAMLKQLSGTKQIVNQHPDQARLNAMVAEMTAGLP